MSQQHIAAIHTLKSKLRMSDDDYRSLLVNLTGKTSSKEMSISQREQVRDHLTNLAVKMGVAKPTRSQRNATFAAARNAASPKERKIWALWNQLHRDGKIANHSAPALNAWVKRQVGVDALRFANDAQLNTLIESLKDWVQR